MEIYDNSRINIQVLYFIYYLQKKITEIYIRFQAIETKSKSIQIVI